MSSKILPKAKWSALRKRGSLALDPTAPLGSERSSERSALLSESIVISPSFLGPTSRNVYYFIVGGRGGGSRAVAEAAAPRSCSCSDDGLGGTIPRK